MLATVLSLCVAGCGTTATIQQTDGGRVEGRITGGSFDEVWLLDPKGREHRIARDQIVDIDHPGAIATAAGIAFLVLGILIIRDNLPNCENRGDTTCVQTIAPVPVGLGVLGWGSTVYARSVKATKPGPPHGLEPPPSSSLQAPPIPSYVPSASATVALPATPVVPVPRPPATGVPAGAPAPPRAAAAPAPAPTNPLPAPPQ